MDGQTQTHLLQVKSQDKGKIDFGNTFIKDFTRIKIFVVMFCKEQAQYLEYLGSTIGGEGYFSECKRQTNLFLLWKDVQAYYTLSDIRSLPIAHRYEFGNLSL